jgi:protocatechuate 4,5-dioxygenase beta chain
MARLVSLIAVPHDPTLPISQRLDAEGKANPGALPALAHLRALKQQLDAARPDAIVVVGSDHLGQWFMNNMPAFMVGKATRMKGPFASEIRSWGLKPMDLPIDGELARKILKGGLNRGVDFAYSDEFTADHSFTIPLNFLRPEDDLAVVPVFINLLAPPVPPGWRYKQVGHVIRQAIEDDGTTKRVALIATGHMSNSVGGPGMMRSLTEPESEWDRTIWSLIKANNVEAIVAMSTWDQLYAQGNGTPGFLGYLLALGAAKGSRPGFAELVATTAQPACAFLEWDEAALNGATP